MADQSIFVESWLVEEQYKSPDCKVIEALREATKSGVLDEGKLLQKLRELSKPKTKEKQNDQS